MKFRLERTSGDYGMTCYNEDGNSITTDATPDIGGTGYGVRPMQLLIMALGSCTAIDVIMILKKQRQVLEDFKIEINADREADKEPSLWKDVHIHYQLFGKVDPEKARKAIELSMDKYCSVAATLRPNTQITFDFEVIKGKDQDKVLV